MAEDLTPRRKGAKKWRGNCPEIGPLDATRLCGRNLMIYRRSQRSQRSSITLIGDLLRVLCALLFRPSCLFDNMTFDKCAMQLGACMRITSGVAQLFGGAGTDDCHSTGRQESGRKSRSACIRFGCNKFNAVVTNPLGAHKCPTQRATNHQPLRLDEIACVGLAYYVRVL